jgi:23S rRNA (cytidine1920-2'-O)/16S rRNA (cytidine1409-2'-O)-methyltransferase
MKQRLDKLMVAHGLCQTRSEAENWIRLGAVTVAGRVVSKPGYFVDGSTEVVLKAPERYVSRAGLKLASVAEGFGIDFADKTVLDVGSSTGGFTDFALQHGASRVYAVDVGTDQMHPSLRDDPRIELHEKTDIRDFVPAVTPDIVVIDVSFVSLRRILPHIATICRGETVVYAMVKPQFEASRQQLTRGGIVKNDTIRRAILREFERWARADFVIVGKADSEIAGAHGNRERFFALKKRSN